MLVVETLPGLLPRYGIVFETRTQMMRLSAILNGTWISMLNAELPWNVSKRCPCLG